MAIQSNPKSFLNAGLILKKMDLDNKYHVADLGCGKFGYFVFPVAKLVGSEGLVYAVDILKENLEEIRKKARLENLQQIKPIWSNLEIFKATKIESNSLDIALLINTLNQSQKRADIIREAVRLLKRNGKLVIVEWKNTDSPFGPKPDHRVKLEALKAKSGELGLNVVEDFDAGEYHYGLILKKL